MNEYLIFWTRKSSHMILLNRFLCYRLPNSMRWQIGLVNESDDETKIGRRFPGNWLN